jgi:hypothetical protein
MCEGVNQSNDWTYNEGSWDWYAPTTQSPEAHGGAGGHGGHGGHGYGGAGGTGYGVVYHNDRGLLALAKLLVFAVAFLGILGAVTAAAVGLIAASTALVIVGVLGLPVALVHVGTRPLGLVLGYRDNRARERHELRKMLLQAALQQQAYQMTGQSQITAYPEQQSRGQITGNQYAALPRPQEQEVFVFDEREGTYVPVRAKRR